MMLKSWELYKEETYLSSVFLRLQNTRQMFETQPTSSRNCDNPLTLKQICQQFARHISEITNHKVPSQYCCTVISLPVSCCVLF